MCESMDSRARGQEANRNTDSIVFPRLCAYGFRTMDRVSGARRDLLLRERRAVH